MNSRLQPKVEQCGNVKIITFTGDKLGYMENVLADELEGRTDDLAACHLLLDFTRVECLGSLELGTLIGLHKRLIVAGGRLTLFNLSPLVYEVFTATRLQTLLGICREDKKQPTPATPELESETNGTANEKGNELGINAQKLVGDDRGSATHGLEWR